MDLFSRKIIAWVLTEIMEAEEVLRCIEIAKKRRNIKNPLVIQSNCGVQFTSAKYAEITDKMIMSYSHKGTPWDNTCIESFHALIKREWLNFYKIENYNMRRIHSHCGYLSPNDYERKYILELINNNATYLTNSVI